VATQRRSRGISLHILYLDAKWQWMLKSRLLKPQEREPTLKIVEVVWASMASLDGYGENRGSCFHQGFNP